MMKKLILFCLTYGLMTAAINAQPCNTGTLTANQTICSGTAPETMVISGFEVGGHLQWQSSTDNVNFTNLAPGDTTASFNPGVLTDQWYYRVQVSGTACDTAWSNTVTITVDQPPTAPTAITGAEDALCNGNPVNLAATGGDEGAGADYVWGSGSVIGTNTIDTTDNATFTTGALTESTTFWVRRIAASASACTTTTGGVSQLVTVRQALSVSITDPGELCQLPAQAIEVVNETDGQPEVHITWSSQNGQNGDTTFTTNVEIPLNMELASGTSNFVITSYGFSDAPSCTISNVVSEVFDIKPRPQIGSVLHSDLTPSDNPLCQGYGPVQFDVSTPGTVSWIGSYYINNQLNEGSIGSSPYDLQTDSVGSHSFSVDSLWYNTGLACGYNPADYETPNVYSHLVTIKPTPPPVEFIAGAPQILQFCNYFSPLVEDSVAVISDLDVWVDNAGGYSIEWKGANDNMAPGLNSDIPLADNEDYYPVYELNGCHSILDAGSPFFIISLLPLPDLSQSQLLYPDSICSGVPFDILFDPAENISDFSIMDYSFNAPLSSANITDTASFSNIPGWDFSISNESENAASWTANIYAQNKNISEINPVTCWSTPVPIEIVINPNATLNPVNTTFGSCQDGSSFSIDPGWNGVGDVEWDEPLGLPVPTSIDNDTKTITVDMSAGNASPGEYQIHISGEYPGSDCTVEETFTVHIYASPQISTHILDIDGTICHNEYTHIEVVEPAPDFVYQWACTGCETTTTDGSTFLPHWENPDPGEGTWNDKSATYSLTVTDTTTHCSTLITQNVNVLADYASCPEGIDFFEPNGLSLVDQPALYFQWYDVADDTVFSEISGASEQTFFPPDDIDSCNTSQYIVASSLYSDRCWSTTLNCFEGFGLRQCDGPKSKRVSNEFMLYPNPAAGSDVILENLDPDLKGRYNIALIDITGKTVFSEIVRVESAGGKVIPLPQLVTGVYVFRITNPKYTQSIKLIIN